MVDLAQSDQVPMLVVPDIDEVFFPLRTGLFVNPVERWCVASLLLRQLPNLSTLQYCYPTSVRVYSPAV